MEEQKKEVSLEDRRSELQEALIRVHKEHLINREVLKESGEEISRINGAISVLNDLIYEKNNK